MAEFDAVVIGSGPNGLSAGIELARSGAKVLIMEASETIGGGTRTAELTLPGFKHDFCSAVHPTGFLSPFWRKLPLEKYGLEWIKPQASVAHPLEGEEAVLLTQDIDETADNLGKDGRAWQRLFRPFLKDPHALLEDALAPLGIPKRPFLLARYGIKAILPVCLLAKYQFKAPRARALLAGNGAHSLISLDMLFSSAIALMFSIMGHTVDWPIVKGGSQRLTEALANYFKSLGGAIQVSARVRDIDQLPPAKSYLFDTDPIQLADIAQSLLPKGYLRRLRRYNFGPGVFKLDWALNGSIPWSDPRCLKASTVHVGGSWEEIAASEKAAWKGDKTERPFVMVCQQSEFDKGRAPQGKQTGYAYCHLPSGSRLDYTEIIENQIERFAPGFKDIILKRYKISAGKFYEYNPNFYGGAITGGAADISQLFTRPVARLDPYSTPNPRIFICSASSPPGGGVHGMCGYFAARSALKAL